MKVGDRVIDRKTGHIGTVAAYVPSFYNDVHDCEIVWDDDYDRTPMKEFSRFLDALTIEQDVL